jgi:hypothetical protein
MEEDHTGKNEMQVESLLQKILFNTSPSILQNHHNFINKVPFNFQNKIDIL